MNARDRLAANRRSLNEHRPPSQKEHRWAIETLERARDEAKAVIKHCEKMVDDPNRDDGVRAYFSGKRWGVLSIMMAMYPEALEAPCPGEQPPDDKWTPQDEAQAAERATLGRIYGGERDEQPPQDAREGA